MLELWLWIALAFTGMLFFVRWITRWGVQTAQRQIEAKIRALETITNEEAVPAEWLLPYQRQVARLPAHQANEERVVQIARRAQCDCLRRLDGLAKYFKAGAFVDSPATRDLLIDALRDQRHQWLSQDWRALVQPDAIGGGHRFSS